MLNSALESFRAAQNTLKDVEKYVEEDKVLKINPEGVVYCDPPPEDQDRVAAIQKAYLDTVRWCNERITTALSDADTADTALHWALTRDVNGKNKGFNSDSSTTIKEAAQGRRQAEKDAREFVKLAAWAAS